jgi:hypothetical protein
MAAAYQGEAWSTARVALIRFRIIQFRIVRNRGGNLDDRAVALGGAGVGGLGLCGAGFQRTGVAWSWGLAVWDCVAGDPGAWPRVIRGAAAWFCVVRDVAARFCVVRDAAARLCVVRGSATRSWRVFCARVEDSRASVNPRHLAWSKYREAKNYQFKADDLPRQARQPSVRRKRSARTTTRLRQEKMLHVDREDVPRWLRRCSARGRSSALSRKMLRPEKMLRAGCANTPAREKLRVESEDTPSTADPSAGGRAFTVGDSGQRTPGSGFQLAGSG